MNDGFSPVSVFKPSGLLLTSALSEVGEGILMSWNLESRCCLYCVQAHHGPIRTIAHGPHENGPILTGGADKRLCVWDSRLQCQSSVLCEHQTEVHGLAIEPDECFYSIAGDGVLRAWSVEAPLRKSRKSVNRG